MFGFLTSVQGVVGGIISIIVGIMILVWPRFLTTLIGLYLIVVGVIALLSAL